MVVQLSVPSTGQWEGMFGMCFAGLVHHNAVKGISCTMQQRVGSILPASRQGLIDNAIQTGCSHVLFLDDDMLFPPDTLERLLKYGLPCVAASCPAKTPTPNQTAFVKPDQQLKLEDFGSKQLLKVWRVGTGVMLVRLDVFQKIEKPYFNFTWKPEDGSFMGEDWYMVEAIEKAGYSTYVDLHLSAQIGHIGKKVFTPVALNRR